MGLFESIKRSQQSDEAAVVSESYAGLTLERYAQLRRQVDDADEPAGDAPVGPAGQVSAEDWALACAAWEARLAADPVAARRFAELSGPSPPPAAPGERGQTG